MKTWGPIITRGAPKTCKDREGLMLLRQQASQDMDARLRTWTGPAV